MQHSSAVPNSVVRIIFYNIIYSSSCHPLIASPSDFIAYITNNYPMRIKTANLIAIIIIVYFKKKKKTIRKHIILWVAPARLLPNTYRHLRIVGSHETTLTTFAYRYLYIIHTYYIMYVYKHILLYKYDVQQWVIINRLTRKKICQNLVFVRLLFLKKPFMAPYALPYLYIFNSCRLHIIIIIIICIYIYICIGYCKYYINILVMRGGGGCPGRNLTLSFLLVVRARSPMVRRIPISCT